eukprot:TRINITY_DN57332_c0_g1_i1.p1 TRINITY_DN57332_c0_g1~~TRINITY_DN57332_c0_g1_i1.p1  ORF type:complete len:360 (+),score=80.90 TRINITY_DN57332_c0_g1_i1:88-1080(+)
MPIASLSDFSKESGGSDGASGESLPPYGPGGIYHEKQIGNLCAVHCVNNMLQGPMFDYSDFGQVARELDAAERKITGGEGLDYGNARADGFFNVQVMQTVLTRGGYSMSPIGGEEVQSSKTDTAKEQAFILNKREHWFALRRIGREWFDLNSCIKTPQHYTDADVRFHIRDAVREGYMVFVVRGAFPKSALEEDSKKLVEAVQGCGRPGQGYSLFAGSGQRLDSGGGGSSAPAGGGSGGGGAAGGADAVRAARLARFGGGGAPAPAPPATAAPAAAPAPAPAPAAAPAPAPADPNLAMLTSMGFDEAAAKKALQSANGNLERATDILLSS